MKNARFTIVLPVRSGGVHLRQCVSSILAQSLDDFELAVLENCSNDGTAEWLAGVGDSRIRVYPASTPLSMEQNWARAVNIPKNEFVTFLGHDDLLDPEYLKVMNTAIGENPDAAVYHAHFRFVNENGRTIGPCRPMPARETAAEFTKAFLHFERDANGTGYMVRSREFERAGGFPQFHKLLYADHALWLNIVSGSYVSTSPQECFSYRLHASSTSSSSVWRDHLQAIGQLLDFLDGGHRWGEEIAEIYKAYAPGYFLKLCTNWCAIALVQATKQNRRLEPDVLDAFAATLERVTPQGAEQFRNSKSIRHRQIINSYWPMRTAYILYILARYGRSELS